MSFLVVAPNGEIVEIGTGVVQGFVPSNFPQLSADANTLLRYWDGVSAEPLGSIPKIVALSKEEQRLLSRLQPWKFLKYAVKQDYIQLIAKINRQRLALFHSIRMKNARADPNSVYNSIEYREAHRLGLIERYNAPGYRAYWSILMKQIHIPGGRLAQQTSENMKMWWAVGDRRQEWGYKMSQYFASLSKEDKAAQKKQAWETRRKKYGSGGTSVEGGYSKITQDTWDKVNERGRKRHGERCRRGHAWKKLSDVMKMLYDDDVVIER